MLTAEIKNNLALLRKGGLDASAASSFEHLSARLLMDELASVHPFVFQKRDQGRKHEIGLARDVAYQFLFRKLSDSLLHAVRIQPTLRSCYLVSAYDDEISEVTWTARIHVRPIRRDRKGLVLSFGKGFKMDKTIDGWEIRSLLRRKMQLSEELLDKHGWQFDVLPPFGFNRSVRTA